MYDIIAVNLLTININKELVSSAATRRPSDGHEDTSVIDQRAGTKEQGLRAREKRGSVLGDVDASRRHVGGDGGRIQEEDPGVTNIGDHTQEQGKMV